MELYKMSEEEYKISYNNALKLYQKIDYFTETKV